MKRKSFLFLVVLVVMTLLYNAPVYAADFVTDAIYVKNANTEQCFRFTSKPKITYSMNEMSVFVNGVCELTIPLGSDVNIRFGVYNEDTGVDEIFVVDPAKNDNQSGKYFYRGQVIVVQKGVYFDINGTKIK